jgi:hypothetical protein
MSVSNRQEERDGIGTDVKTCIDNTLRKRETLSLASISYQ